MSSNDRLGLAEHDGDEPRTNGKSGRLWQAARDGAAKADEEVPDIAAALGIEGFGSDKKGLRNGTAESEIKLHERNKEWDG